MPKGIGVTSGDGIEGVTSGDGVEEGEEEVV